MVSQKPISESKPQGSILGRTLTSLLVSLITCLLVAIGNNLYVALLAKKLGFVIKLNITGIDISPKINWYYNLGKEIVLFLLPSLVPLLFSLFLSMWLRDHYKKNTLLRFFLFWLMMWCFLWPFAQMLAAPFTMINWENNVNYQGLAVIANWVLIPPFAIGILGILGIGIVTLFGFFNARYFFRYIWSLQQVGSRRFWLQAMFYLPLSGTIPICIFLSWPRISLPHIFFCILAVFFGIGMSLSVRFYKAPATEEGLDVTRRPNTDLLVTAVMLIVFARFIMPVLF